MASGIYVSRGKKIRLYASKAEFDRRSEYPYGIWSLDNGREVLFNRFYEPIWERQDGGKAIAANPAEWVKGKGKQEWFYEEGDTERQKLACARAILRQWGI